MGEYQGLGHRVLKYDSLWPTASKAETKAEHCPECAAARPANNDVLKCQSRLRPGGKREEKKRKGRQAETAPLIESWKIVTFWSTSMIVRLRYSFLLVAGSGEANKALVLASLQLALKDRVKGASTVRASRIVFLTA